MSGTSSSLPPTNPLDAARHRLDSASSSPACSNTMHNGLAHVSLDDSPGSLSQPSSSPPPTAISAAASSSTTPTRFPAGHIQFRSNTIAPSPPLSRSPTASTTTTTTTTTTASPLPSTSPALSQLSNTHIDDPFFRHQPSTPQSSTALDSGLGIITAVRAGNSQSPLRIQTDLQPPPTSFASSASFAIPITPRTRPEPPNFNPPPSSPGAIATPSSSYVRPSTLALQHKSSASSLRPISRTPSLKTTGFHGFGSASAASSTVASPIITAMGDVTPLPSPLLSSDSPGPWKKLRSPHTEALSGPTSTLTPGESAFATSHGESLSSALAHHAKRRAYAELMGAGAGQRAEGGPAQADLRPSHTRDRSLSDYVPDQMQLPKRMVAVSAMHSKQAGAPNYSSDGPFDTHMRREPHLSEARGLTPVQKPPTPPPSESSLLLSDGVAASEPNSEQQRCEYFEAISRKDNKRQRWRSIKMLGQGTFSRVMLATNQMSVPERAADNCEPPPLSGPSRQVRYDRRTLVAVKVCEHGPKGGASEDRIEMSLKRELEIMQCIHHPSLVRLKASSIEPTRALLVLSYCPGGDLFDVASAHRSLLTPRLLARMFAEQVEAVRYLHHEHIVHRDIKLENVLVNLTPEELADKSIDWATYPYSVTTLTDLGLSRRVADDEKLETRCGSDDYAAPEVIMGQPYDGRATDAWSLGVLLYALLEGRLPFDPTPGMSDAHRMRSRTSHRIARVEWRWVEYAGDDGDHEGDIAKFEEMGLVGAMELTEGLLKRARSRWTMDKVAGTAWVRGGLNVAGGLRFREEEEGEEIS